MLATLRGYPEILILVLTWLSVKLFTVLGSVPASRNDDNPLADVEVKLMGRGRRVRDSVRWEAVGRTWQRG